MRPVRTYLLILAVLAFSSCIKMPSYEDWLARQQAAELAVERWSPSECKESDLVLKEFSLLVSDNSSMLVDIVFKSDVAGRYEAIVSRYRLKEYKLIPNWLGTAASVTVDGVEQVPGESAQDFSKPVTYVFHSSDGGSREYTFTLIQGDVSNVAVVALNTRKEVTKKDNWYGGELGIFGGGYAGRDTSYVMEAKLRGNNSSSKPKKSYTIRLEKKAGILGMPKSKRWLLIANASDRTLLRNKAAYHLASMTSLRWTPSCEFCELFVNGEYRGLYLMMEQIRVEKNRVDIDKENGFLLECDRYTDENSFRTAVRDLPINIKSPDSDTITQAQRTYIKDYFKKVEQYLYREELPDPRYRELIDIGSFVDWWIVTEVTHLAESRLPGSVWYHKDVDGKLCAGPVWDFDLTTFKYSNSFLLYDYCTTDWNKSQRSLWYHRLFLDPEFKALAKQRWMLYKPLFETIPDYIDRQMDVIRGSVGPNCAIWTTISGSNNDNNLSWEDACTLMKQNFMKRMETLDQSIALW